RLIVLSLAWVLLGLLLALANPWLGLMPNWLQGIVNIGALVVTGVFIVADAVMSVALVGRTRRTLTALPLTVVQFVLFALLFFQIACHQGGAAVTAADGVVCKGRRTDHQPIPVYGAQGDASYPDRRVGFSGAFGWRCLERTTQRSGR